MHQRATYYEGRGYPLKKNTDWIIYEKKWRNEQRISPIPELTLAQFAVTEMMVKYPGISNWDLADKMNLRVDTIKTHLKHCYYHAQVNTRTQYYLWAKKRFLELGLSLPEEESNDYSSQRR